MTVENDAMLEEELACQFKIDMRTFTSFDTSTRKSKKFALYQLLTKVFNICARKRYREIMFDSTQD